MLSSALFYEDNTSGNRTFIGAVTHDGHPDLPNETNSGIDVLFLSTKSEVIEYLKKWNNQYINYYNEKNLDPTEHVVWNENEYYELVLIPIYIYYLVDGNMYVSSIPTIDRVLLKDYIIHAILKANEIEFSSCSDCLVKVRCNRSLDDNTLCEAAYCEAEAYILSQK